MKKKNILYVPISSAEYEKFNESEYGSEKMKAKW